MAFAGKMAAGQKWLAWGRSVLVSKVVLLAKRCREALRRRLRDIRLFEQAAETVSERSGPTGDRDSGDPRVRDGQSPRTAWKRVASGKASADSGGR